MSDYEEENVLVGFYPSLCDARKLLGDSSDSSRSPSPDARVEKEKQVEVPKEVWLHVRVRVPTCMYVHV